MAPSSQHSSIVEESYNVQMTLTGGVVYRLRRMPFRAIVKKKLHNFSMSIGRSEIHSVRAASFTSMLVQKADDLQVSVGCSCVHGLICGANGGLFVEIFDIVAVHSVLIHGVFDPHLIVRRHLP
ncbi:unnamed protein product [Aphanomyces euteiches]